MNLNQYISALRELADTGHGELPVCMGNENAFPYMQEVTEYPTLANGNYGGDADTAFSSRVGPYIDLNT